MGAVAVSSLVDALESVMFARLIADMQSMDFFKIFTIGQQAKQVDTMGWISLVFSILAAGMFILWFFPAYRNLERLGKSLNHNPGWAIGAWFTPILNLFRPYEIYSEMAETYSMIAQKFPQHMPAVMPGRRQLVVLGGWWWGLYLPGRILANVADSVVRNAKGVPSAWVTWPNYLVAISGVVAILVIYRLNKVEAVVYRAWLSGDYQAFLEAKEAAKAEKIITPEDGKSADWYKTEAENDKSLNRNEDPFS
jgi:hypothetical protein